MTDATGAEVMAFGGPSLNKRNRSLLDDRSQDHFDSSRSMDNGTNKGVVREYRPPRLSIFYSEKSRQRAALIGALQQGSGALISQQDLTDGRHKQLKRIGSDPTIMKKKGGGNLLNIVPPESEQNKKYRGVKPRFHISKVIPSDINQSASKVIDTERSLEQARAKALPYSNLSLNPEEK